MEKGAIGVFDSGLGGLLLLKSLRELMPNYDYIFFGDQAYVPYGNKSEEELLNRAKKVFTFLFEEKNCTIIFLACNTTSTTIFDELREWVKDTYPGRKIWGIVRPTVESVDPQFPVVFFGTHRTITSHKYRDEMIARGQENVVEIEMPELATRIEEGKDTYEYISSFSSFDTQSHTGVLVCTHYGIAREDFKKAFPHIEKWIYQEDVLPPYIHSYLSTHPDEKVSTDGTLSLLVSAPNPTFDYFSEKWFNQKPDNISL
jgi:glutamate racemase